MKLDFNNDKRITSATLPFPLNGRITTDAMFFLAVKTANRNFEESIRFMDSYRILFEGSPYYDDHIQALNCSWSFLYMCHQSVGYDNAGNKIEPNEYELELETITGSLRSSLLKQCEMLSYRNKYNSTLIETVWEAKKQAGLNRA